MKEVEDTGFKLWYTGATSGRNGVGILIDRSLKDGFVDVRSSVFKASPRRCLGIHAPSTDLRLARLVVQPPHLARRPPYRLENRGWERLALPSKARQVPYSVNDPSLIFSLYFS